MTVDAAVPQVKEDHRAQKRIAEMIFRRKRRQIAPSIAPHRYWKISLGILSKGRFWLRWMGCG
jgi:hypothetical protein